MIVVVHVNTVEPVLFVMPAVGNEFTVAVTAVLDAEIQPVVFIESSA